MKKIILLILVASLLLSTATALAETDKEEEICELVEKNSNVTKAVCLVEQRLCIVAIQANKFGSRSEYQKFVTETIEKIQQTYHLDKVIITRNSKLFYQIKKISSLNEDQRLDLVENLLEELAKVPSPQPYFPELHEIFTK